ncbi:TRAP transporter fused permease subunit [Sulfidibacter corallicola]|uniref:TRAP transporter fused permease subunit n=1 Tax=Sulfidibacter corallicola TaxID=2818388 RepID=A0A8A4TQ35_SULCO|nr:TRAP transporter fused permease subunit [Sulfidibacter corallicola]QTD48675.1 TRAP transporter fused permease subunit [Sulfidibacter corallicola]
MLARLKSGLEIGAGVALCLFVLAEVNYPQMQPQSQLALFAMFGLVLCFLKRPLHPALADHTWAQILDFGLVGLSILSLGFLVVQTEPWCAALWLNDLPLGNRAGIETRWDILAGAVGLLLILEATRRAIGWTLPLLSSAFLLYGWQGRAMPSWLFPHRGYDWERLVSQSFLHSQGVFGPALKVMFTFVFLFVLFGAFLERTGATKALIRLAQRLFRRSQGGSAKVAVVASGLMGSLSGSAVANTATTGTFTIPLMRSSGFPKTFAAAIEAAASSGGALVPPVMGAGAYMMLELVMPQVTFLQIMRAAVFPALLYYLALLLLVHFLAARFAAEGGASTESVPAASEVPASTEDASPGTPTAPADESSEPESTGERHKVFIFTSAFAVLVALLLWGFSPFRSVTMTIPAILVLSWLKPETRLGWRELLAVFRGAASQAIPLVVAAACVGIVIGVVTLTGLGIKFPAELIPLAEKHLVLALILMMVAALILGMGLPSAVCYLLLASLMGPVLTDLGVVPLAAHFFIFYFGLLSMVTPPVALAAYTAASIADSHVMPTGWAAFRFSFAGFTLPYAFIFRPELLMLAPGSTHEPAAWSAVVLGLIFALGAVLALAASLSGYWFRPLSLWVRGLLFVLALLLLAPQNGTLGPLVWAALPALAALGLGLWRTRIATPTQSVA